jgi:membrane-associated protease RseP (regulator of RpoE activity)
MKTAYEKFQSEMVAGGAVENREPDEVAGGWRGAVGLLGLAALLGWLAVTNIWWFIFVVGILISVVLHELGHFVTARATGMKATQFFIGFGPRLWSMRRGETEYGVRALPLGAFVRIVGMSNLDEVEPGDEDRAYRVKSYPRRLLVITAGSLMHLIIAIGLLFLVFSIAGENSVRDGARITGIEPSGPAAVSQLEVDDVVVGVAGQPVADPSGLGELIRAQRPGDTIALDVDRNNMRQSVEVFLGANTDESSPLFGKPYIGVSSSPNFVTVDHSPVSAAVRSVTAIPAIAWESARGIVRVVNPLNVLGHLSGQNDDITTRPTTLVGVTGISDDVGESEGLIGILFLLAVLNIFVGVFNMFPLLPLDGGHAAIASYERLRERNGQRYYADVARLMPLTMGVIAALLFLFMAGLYLDITDPLGG